MKRVEFTILKFRLLIFLALMGSIFIACNSENKTEKVKGCDNFPSFKEDLKKDTKLNLSIFIDLSYRIDTSENHGKNIIKKDLAVIEKLAKTWKKHVCRKPIQAYNDEFNIRVDPIPEGLENYFKKLRFDLAEKKKKSTDQEFKTFLSNFEDTVKSRVEKIYQTVYNKGFNSHEDWIGSDIYGLFSNNNRLNKCRQANADNVLVVLTDGYISRAKKNDGLKEQEFNNLLEKKFKKDGPFYKKGLKSIKKEGYQFKPTSSNLENLEVIFAGIDPYVSASDYEKIKYFLSNWLEGMKVENYKIFKSKGAIEDNKEDIEDYFSS